MDWQKIRGAAEKTLSDKYVLGLGAAAVLANYLGLFELDGLGGYFQEVPHYDVLMHGTTAAALGYTGVKAAENLEVPVSKAEVAAGVLALGIGWEILEHYLASGGILSVAETGLTSNTAQDLAVDAGASYLAADYASKNGSKCPVLEYLERANHYFHSLATQKATA
ncbi:MAG: hypothetical protein JW727_03040 [Candidatus Aenigmarchaeota archaeon]|nr:hypothetical protein [Candidatus Aenigmarchaeota archaeon]